MLLERIYDEDLAQASFVIPSFASRAHIGRHVVQMEVPVQ